MQVIRNTRDRQRTYNHQVLRWQTEQNLFCQCSLIC
jgi:hypothetical protein